MKNVILLFAILLSTASFAQNSVDTIFKKNKEVLLVKIIEVGLEEVKYKPLLNPNDITLVIEIAQIDKIVYANGVVQKFTDPLNDKSSYADNHLNSIKFNFLSPLHKRVHLHYEHSIKPGFSYECGANVIGIGQSKQLNQPYGVSLNAGIRMYRMPELRSRSDRFSHVLNGGYFQPTLTFGTIQHQYLELEAKPNNTYSETERKSSQQFMAFTFNFGKQFIFANRISFDISTGLGYGTFNNKVSDFEEYIYDNQGKDIMSYNDPTQLGVYIAPRSGLSLNFQVQVGYLFK